MRAFVSLRVNASKNKCKTTHEIKTAALLVYTFTKEKIEFKKIYDLLDVLYQTTIRNLVIKKRKKGHKLLK